MKQTKEEKFFKKMNKIIDKFHTEIHKPMVDLVNEYKENENAKSFDYFEYKEEIRRLDDFALLTGWIIDRLDDKKGFIGSPAYNKTLTKKIRKALGFTY